jgi:capsular polysaccharide biosynthesis protein
LEDSPSSPNTKKNIAIGGILGIVASAGLVIVMYLLNDTISSEEDVEKYLGLNNLGIIPMDEGEMEQIMRDRRKRKGETGGILKRIFPEKHK